MFSGTWHVATCTLRVPGDSPWVVDVFRQWNFSICSIRTGVTATLVKGYNLEICQKMLLPKNFKKIYLYPSTKIAVTPVLVEQIEKFHCLNTSTTQGLSPGTLRVHVATCHVPENVSQSFSTLTWNNSKNRNYLIWWSMRSSCRHSQASENICHCSGGIFYIDWAPWGSVI